MVLNSHRIPEVPHTLLDTHRSDNTVASKTTLFAKKEVILSAGTYGTPIILLHSGIGDRQTLSGLGIPILHELPSVGKNLSDQPVTSLVWLVNTTDTPDTAARNATLAAEQLAEWMNHTGPLGDNVDQEIGFFRVNKTGTPIENLFDPSAGPNTAHFEMLTLVSPHSLNDSMLTR